MWCCGWGGGCGGVCCGGRLLCGGVVGGCGGVGKEASEVGEVGECGGESDTAVFLTLAEKKGLILSPLHIGDAECCGEAVDEGDLV